MGKYRKVKTKVNKLNKILNPVVYFFKETFLKYKDSENTKSERITKVRTMQTLIYTLQTLQEDAVSVLLSNNSENNAQKVTKNMKRWFIMFPFARKV